MRISASAGFNDGRHRGDGRCRNDGRWRVGGGRREGALTESEGGLDGGSPKYPCQI